MVTSVNPPPQIRLPKAFQKDREIQTYFRHVDRMMLQLWKRTGGAEDVISDSTASDISDSTLGVDAIEVSEDEAEFYYQPLITPPAWNAVTKASTYYAVSWDFIEAQTKYIYLPEFPDENDQVIVSSDYNQDVIVLGNGNKVKVKEEESSITISQKGTSLHFIYFIDGGYWRIV